jgi:tellurite resistance protein TerC
MGGYSGGLKKARVLVESGHTTTTLGVITIIIQLIFLEGILSIDNAAVLGAMVSTLPKDKMVPYPGFLKFLQNFTNRVLGMQQSAALKVGLLGAYLGRGLMLLMAAWVIANPLLKVLGAAYLIKLAFENLAKAGQGEAEEGGLNNLSHPASSGFWLVVLNVELADLAFSLDNVVAAVALSDELWVVLVGVALGIITMRFAATAFTWLIQREPILEQAAYLIVLNIGVELLAAEFYEIEIAAWQKFLISAATLGLCVAYAHLPFLRVLNPALHWLAEGMGHINKLVEWIFHPLIVMIKFPFSLGKSVVAKKERVSAPPAAVWEPVPVTSAEPPLVQTPSGSLDVT